MSWQQPRERRTSIKTEMTGGRKPGRAALSRWKDLEQQAGKVEAVQARAQEFDVYPTARPEAENKQGSRSSVLHRLNSPRAGQREEQRTVHGKFAYCTGRLRAGD